MQEGIRTPLEHIEDALGAADMAWWELEFPSGALRFSKHKTDMLGYDKGQVVERTDQGFIAAGIVQKIA